MTMNKWLQASVKAAVIMLGVAGVMLSTVAMAAPSKQEAAKMVENYFNSLTTMRADFSQQTVGDAFVMEGTFSVKKPHRFLWQYETPNKQKVVSNGVATYFVDEERNQVTQLPNNAGIARFFNTSSLTMKKIGAKVSDVREQDGALMVTLAMDGKIRAKDREELKEVTLVFHPAAAGQKAPEGLVLEQVKALDGMGKTTVVMLTNVKTGLSLSNSMFDYTPPQYRNQ